MGRVRPNSQGGLMRALTTFTILTLFSNLAFASETGDPSRGRALAAKDCAECHSIEKGDAPSPVDGLASFETIANAEGMSPLALEVWLTTPHREMPHLILDADERNDLIAYITSLKQ